MSRLDHERFVDLALLRRIARVELDLVDDAVVHGSVDLALLRRIASVELDLVDRFDAEQAAPDTRLARIMVERVAPILRGRADDLAKTRSGGDA